MTISHQSSPPLFQSTVNWIPSTPTMSASTSGQHGNRGVHHTSNTTPFTLSTKLSSQFRGAAFLKRCLNFNRAPEARTSPLPPPPNTPSRRPAAQTHCGRKRKRGAGTSHVVVETDQETTKKRLFGGMLGKVKKWCREIVKRREIRKGKGREKLVKRRGGSTRAGGYRGRRQGGRR